MADIDIWNPQYPRLSPIYEVFAPWNAHFANFQQWPQLTDYQALFRDDNSPVTPVAQADQARSYEEGYEPRIYLRKELQTRLNNWHDFFNALVWLRFPQTKRCLNALHYSQSSQTPQNRQRSPLENRITQFDECGMVIVSRRAEYLELIRQHQWQQLFIDERSAFEQDIRVIVFGHAIYEKALTPYIGMTCHGLLFQNNQLLDSILDNNYTALDAAMAGYWEGENADSPTKLQAYPILGTPGLWPDQDDSFYTDETYFRPKRQNIRTR